MPMSDRSFGGPKRLFWSARVSLTSRILAVNVIALVLLAGSLFYLDSYRNQLLAERFQLAEAEAEIIADALHGATRRERKTLLEQIGTDQQLRLRLYDKKGKLAVDSFTLAPPSFTLADPTAEPWYQHAARALDRGMDFVLGAPPIPAYAEPEPDEAASWP